MTVGEKALAHMMPTSGSVPRQVGTLPPDAAPDGADAAVSAGALPKARDPLPPDAAPDGADAAVSAGALPKANDPLLPDVARDGADVAVSAGALSKARDPLPAPYLAEAVRAAAAARAAAARIRATVVGGGAAVVAEQPGGAAALDRSRWRGLSVAEAAAAATISFRPLRRPFGRLPHGAPQYDVQPIEAGAIADDARGPEPTGASAPSEAGTARPVATTIAELERLRQAARQPENQPQLLLMNARA